MRGSGDPQGVYRCAGDDEWVALAVESEDQWLGLSEVAGIAVRRGWGLAESVGRGVADDGVEWLTRGDRSVEEWVADLRAMGSGGRRTYRASPPSREALFRIALDPAADEDVRAGAAIALGGSLDDSERERLRVAARVTVAPRVRVVLEREAEGDLDEEEAVHVLASRRLGAT